MRELHSAAELLRESAQPFDDACMTIRNLLDDIETGNKVLVSKADLEYLVEELKDSYSDTMSVIDSKGDKDPSFVAALQVIYSDLVSRTSELVKDIIIKSN